MVNLLLGLVLGVLSSLLAWFVAVGLLTPKIEIRRTVQALDDDKGCVRYRFGIRNKRIFRDAQDLTVKVRCRCRTSAAGHTGNRVRRTFDIPVDDAWVPIIRSRWYWRKHQPKDRNAKITWPQLPVMLIDQIAPWAVDGLPKDRLGMLDLSEVLNPSTHRGSIRLIVTAFDSWSGTKKLFIERFGLDDVERRQVADADSQTTNHGESRSMIRENGARFWRLVAARPWRVSAAWLRVIHWFRAHRGR